MTIRLLFGLALIAFAGACSYPVTQTVQDDPFLDTLQARTFAWYWDHGNPETGLVPNRAPSRPMSSVAGIGFALTGYGVGAERGFITRDQAIDRTLATLRFFWSRPMGSEPAGMSGYRGIYYHFVDLQDGLRVGTNELSSIDTALLMMGVLFAQSYFEGDDPREAEIRALADSLYLRADWGWMQPRAPLISMAWRPERGLGPNDYKGMDEAMFLYVLGLGSPTYPVHEDAWKAYTSTYEWGEFYGQEYVQFSPLFGYHYAHVWIDPRGLQDEYMREKGIDYFENARRATLANRAYVVDNPYGFRDYGPMIWGLTASDGPANVKRAVEPESSGAAGEAGSEAVAEAAVRIRPVVEAADIPPNAGRPAPDTVHFRRYAARGASLRRVFDDGTIAPTAAGGSIVYAPEYVVPTLKAIRACYGDLVFNEHGFVDAFNPTFTFTDVPVQLGVVDPVLGWFGTDHLVIDQGPILLMTENYRTGLVWDVMKRNPYIVRGLCAAGFASPWLGC